MTDLEIYAYWAKACAALDARYLIGEITTYDMERIDENVQERLGMNKWDHARWRKAAEAWTMREKGA